MNEMPLKDRLFILAQYLTPQHVLSRLVGLLAEARAPWLKNRIIGWFVRRYQVDMREAQIEDPLAFDSFNAFFTRALKPDARPLDETPGAILCPADGAVSQIGDIGHGRVFQAKGHSFSTHALLGGDSERAAPFLNGRFATIYLSPRDYHRVHMPISGTLREMIYVPGKLFSVNPLTASAVPDLFARNERVVCIFDTACGKMALVLVGAMIVASMETVWAGQVAPLARGVRRFRYDGPIHLQAGTELGRFRLGSTVILLFGEQQMDWSGELGTGSSVRMGQRLGSCR